MTFAPINAKTAFLNTSEVYPLDPSQLLIKLTGLHTDISNAVNVREISIYQDGQEVLTGQQFSTVGNTQKKRYAFRKVFYFGVIAPGATLNIAHGLTNITSFVHIYGTILVAPGGDWRPIPYVSVAAVGDQVALRVDTVNVIIANGATGPNITSGIVVIEYLYT
jgi:hypothetical protein